MGCFNVSCVMSGISMYADEAVLIPLKASRYESLTQLKGAYFVTNEGAQGLYEVALLPLYGSLDSYGRLEDIKRTKNTEILETYFDQSIGNIAEAAANSWRDEIIPRAGKPVMPDCGAFVHAAVYDKMSDHRNTMQEYSNKTFSAYDEAYMIPHVLVLCGFTFIYTEEKKERYKHLYKHKNFSDLDVWSDGNWIEVKKGNKPYAKRGIYHPTDLHKMMLEEYGVSSVPVKELQEISVDSVYYDAALAQIDRENEELAAMESNGESMKSIIALRRMMGMNWRTQLMIGADRFENKFMEIYGEHLHDPEIKEEYIKSRMFSMNMFGANRPYMPTFNGYQHGNIQAEKKLHEVALEIINAKIEERRKDNEDE